MFAKVFSHFSQFEHVYCMNLFAIRTPGGASILPLDIRKNL
jgi:hypothetical protein